MNKKKIWSISLLIDKSIVDEQCGVQWPRTFFTLSLSTLQSIIVDFNVNLNIVWFIEIVAWFYQLQKKIYIILLKRIFRNVVHSLLSATCTRVAHFIMLSWWKMKHYNNANKKTYTNSHTLTSGSHTQCESIIKIVICFVEFSNYETAHVWPMRRCTFQLQS